MGEVKSDYRLFLSQSLGLRINDFPIGLTVEEKNWFQYAFGYQLYRDINIVTTLTLQAQSLFQTLIKKNRDFQQAVIKSDRVIKFGGKNINGEITFNDDFLPSIRTFLHIKTLYNIIVDEKSFNREDLSRFANRMNYVINRQIFVQESLSPSIVRISKFFKQEAFRGNKISFKAEDLKLLTVYLEAFQLNSHFRKIDKEEHLELYAKVGLAIYELKMRGIELNSITIDILIDKIGKLIKDEKHEKMISSRITRNNIDRNNKDRLNYTLSSEDDDEENSDEQTENTESKS